LVGFEAVTGIREDADGVRGEGSAPRAVVRSPPDAAPKLTRDDIVAIVQEHTSYVWRTLRFLGVRQADLDDACQEVFIVVLRKVEEFEGRSSLKTWLRGICIKTAAAHRRRAHLRSEIPMSGPPDRPGADDPEGDLHQQERLALLDEALNALDDDKRAVFVLYEIEGLPMKEVAEAVGCPLQTAYSRHHAARALVAAHARRHALVTAPPPPPPVEEESA
jgi:RNA polymerase sigma-70 factor, ECF subfamily